MEASAKALLVRWQALKEGEGLRRAQMLARILWVLGLVLVVFSGFLVVERVSPIFTAVTSIAAGWVIAECNALRSRVAQWPIVSVYIDWQKVKEGIGRDA